jgi:hypothetical protein
VKKTLAISSLATQSDISLDELIDELILLQVILTVSKRGRVVPWPGQIVPLRLRSAISQNNGELQRLMKRSDPRLCPNRRLHHHAEIYAVMRWCCPYCAQMQPSVSGRAC